MDAGLSSNLGLSCHFLVPFLVIPIAEDLVISVKVGLKAMTGPNL